MRMDQLPTPCYVIDEKKLKENLQILKEIREEAGCKILLAQKAFSCFYEYPLIGRYLDGTTASGLYEARLGKEEMGKENHVFHPKCVFVFDCHKTERGRNACGDGGRRFGHFAARSNRACFRG